MTQPEFATNSNPENGAEAHANGLLAIRVFGAKTHNLKQIDVEIPIGKLTVITGVSGSGKSSLAFETIYAEGRHRYLSSISSRSREMMQLIDRPDVELIDGLPPVMCLEQNTRAANRRSTVATVSDIFEYLRLLYARVGELNCPNCRIPVTTQSRKSIVDQVLRFEDRQKVQVLAPIVSGRIGAHAEVFAKIVKDGYVRARVDGEVVDATAPPPIKKTEPHNIEIVIDRLIVKDGIQSRLEESLNLALQIGQGQCIVSHDEEGIWKDRLYSSRLSCRSCGTSFSTIEPRSFSFNSAAGACPTCEGRGVIEDEMQGHRCCEACQGTRLGPISRSVLIDGVSITDLCRMNPTAALSTIDSWSRYFEIPEGNGESAAADPSNSSSSEAPVVQGIETEGTAARRSAALHILPEIRNRLHFILDLGLDYLTLDRSVETLSRGEFQRTRIAACLGSHLKDICYILDEPTAGLHSQDTNRLLQSLRQLQNGGNTIVLVEHDLAVIGQADHVIDLGPGAGVLGGEVLAMGTPDALMQSPASITGKFLAARARAKRTDDVIAHSSQDTIAEASSIPSVYNSLRLSGVTLHNLKNVTLTVPLKQLVCVTGVSGSGKTSLVIRTLVPAVRRALGEKIPSGGPFRELIGIESFSKVVRVDQSPLAQSARSSPATYTDVWDNIRQIFSKTKESRLRGYKPNRFSLGNPNSRCRRCSGRGFLPVDERRFSDWSVGCPDCNGSRFSPETMSVRYRGKSVADVLNMSLLEAAEFFANFHKIERVLTIFNELGLGYLKLGQSAATLSGGESQRIKLGTELAKSSADGGATLYVLDEPTAGLHAADIQLLVHVLKQLTFYGHTVLVIEHNEELIRCADWVIGVGPGAGSLGGEIIFNRHPKSNG